MKIGTVGFSNLELPSTRYTLEDNENSLAVSEGLVVGDHAMGRTETIYGETVAENELLLVTDTNEVTRVTVPATLMPVKDFTKHKAIDHTTQSSFTAVSQIETKQRHGWKELLEWKAAAAFTDAAGAVQRCSGNVQGIVVGAEPHESSEDAFSGGFPISSLPGLTFLGEKTMEFDTFTIESIRVGDNAGGGYLYCAPMHLSELVSYMNFSTRNKGYVFSLDAQYSKNNSVLKIENVNGQNFIVSGIINHDKSLRGVLGLTQQDYFRTAHKASRNPSIMRARVEAGYYTQPGSIATAFGAAMQTRCYLPAQETAHGFSISLLDATYNQNVQVPPGLHTPEGLAKLIDSLLVGVNLTMDRTAPNGETGIGWVRYTFSADKDFPFVLDFTAERSSSLAFTLGFHTLRYNSRNAYTGKSIAATATYNTSPCPPVSYAGPKLRTPVVAARNAARYPGGRYIMSGTVPNTQRFEIISMPGKSWAVPNSGTDQTYFTNIDTKGILDITTKQLSDQICYGFEPGDICRMTGYHKGNVSFSASAQSTTGPEGNSGVVGVHSDNMGGRGYNRPPCLTLKGSLADPKEFQVGSVLVSATALSLSVVDMPPVMRALLEADKAEKLSFGQNDLGLEEAVLDDVVGNTLICNVGGLFRQPGTVVTTFSSFMFVEHGAEYKFRVTKADGFAPATDGTFTRTISGDTPYQFTLYPAEIMVYETGVAATKYTRDATTYDRYTKGGGATIQWVQWDQGQKCWKKDDGTQISVVTTDSARYDISQAYNTITMYFLSVETVSGTIVPIQPGSYYENNNISFTGMRPGGSTHPTLTPVVVDGRVTTINVANPTSARYLTIPEVEVAPPRQRPRVDNTWDTEENTITNVQTKTLSAPERYQITFQPTTVHPALLTENVERKGYVMNIYNVHNTPSLNRGYLVVAATATTVTVEMDAYETLTFGDLDGARCALAVGRAVHVNKADLTSDTVYPSMPDLLYRQNYWGQDLPMKMYGVVPMKSTPLSVSTITIQNPSAQQLSTSIDYHPTHRTTTMDVETFAVIPVVRVLVEHGKTYLELGSSNVNLKEGFYIRLNASNTEEEAFRIASVGPGTDRVQVASVSSSSRYSCNGVFTLGQGKMHIDTVKVVLDGEYSTLCTGCADGKTVYLTTSPIGATTGFFAIDRVCADPEIDTGTDTPRWCLYLRNTNGIPLTGLYRVYFDPRIKFSKTGGDAFDFAGNPVVLGGAFAGAYYPQTVANDHFYVDAQPSMPPLNIGSPSQLMGGGTIELIHSGASIGGLEVDDKIYMSNTTYVPPSAGGETYGPYDDGAVPSLSKDVATGRKLDGVWKVFQYDSGANKITVKYDGEISLAMDLARTTPEISLLKNQGTHSFSESMFISGYDVNNDGNDAEWTLNLFHTAESTNDTVVGVGGFFCYDPEPKTAFAVARVTGGAGNYNISSVVPAMPGFVSVEKNSTTPSIQIGYFEGVQSQLNTGENAKGHAQGHANLEQGHIVSDCHLSTGARLSGFDETNAKVTYNIVSAYIPNRITYEDRKKTLLNVHRLRMILSRPYNNDIVGDMTVEGVPMLNGAYGSKAALTVDGDILAGKFVCSHALVTSQLVGWRASSKTLVDGLYVYGLDVDGLYVKAVGADNKTIEFETPSILSDGVSVTLTFEDMSVTRDYKQQTLTSANSAPYEADGTVRPSGTKGAWVRVPVDGLPSSTGVSSTGANYQIKPTVEGQEIEVCAGSQAVVFSAEASWAANKNRHLHAYNTTLASWGPISKSLTDGVLTVPSVCYPGAMHRYEMSDATITFGGDYTTGATKQFNADSSMSIMSGNVTRIGILTASEYDPVNKFRLLFEYNPNGLNAGVGFQDVTNEGTVVMTFSRVFEPRLELLPQHTDAMAIFGSGRNAPTMAFGYDVRNFDWPDSFIGAPGTGDGGHDLLPRQRQYLGRALGATANLYGTSSYVLPAQWDIETQPYRLLFIDPLSSVITGHTALCDRVDDTNNGNVELGQNMDNTDVFAKISCPTSHNVPGPQPRQFMLDPPTTIEQLRVRVMNWDMTPYNLHGREFSLSLVLDGGKSVGRRDP